jgi:DNA processing protein
MNDFESIFYLTKIDGLGSVRIKKLLEHFKEPENIFEASARELSGVDGFSEKLIRSLRGVKKNKKSLGDKFCEIERKMEKLKIGAVTYSDKEYPDLLRKIYDPPVILYYRGVLSKEIFSNLNNSIGVVGTRNPTLYGKDAAENFSTALSSKGMNVISGFARGIDSAAHRSVLLNKESRAFTIAVLGCGVDFIYPPENKKLYEKMINEGLIISECEIGAIPDAVNFPRRNRIISGLSLGVLVIESGNEGGALITARCALDQSREVFAVPGDINSRFSQGTNNLIKNGQAKLVSSVDDILIEFKGKIKNLSLFDDSVTQRSKKENIDLKGNEKLIFDYLSLTVEAVHIDSISENTNLQISDCLVALLNLEFKGFVRQLAGKLFSVIN